MWDLSPLIQDQTHAPAVEAWSLNHWTIGEAQQAHFKNFVQAHFLTLKYFTQ